MKRPTGSKKKNKKKRQWQLLDRYMRRSVCSVAAGLGAFGAAQANAGTVYVDPADFGRSGMDSSTGFRWVSPTNAAYGMSKGIDILQDGGALDIGMFRGVNYGGYLICRTDIVGYFYGNQAGSGQLQVLSNDTELPDTGSSASAPNKSLQGFLPGQIIGDANDADGVTAGRNYMRSSGAPGDWEAGNGVPSYIGFKIDIDNDSSFDGFGWLEVIVNDPDPTDTSGRPDITVTRWAYTDDGSPIVAGVAGVVPEPSTLALLAAGLGAMALGRKRK